MMVREWRLGETDGIFRAPVRGNPAQVAFAWLVGGFATLGAVVLGSVLALVFAATLAFVLVVTAAALTFMAVAWRIRQPRAVETGPVIEARKVGHSWVAYGWDQPS
jgi:zinc transporter ZupT